MYSSRSLAEVSDSCGDREQREHVVHLVPHAYLEHRHHLRRQAGCAAHARRTRRTPRRRIRESPRRARSSCACAHHTFTARMPTCVDAARRVLSPILFRPSSAPKTGGRGRRLRGGRKTIGATRSRLAAPSTQGGSRLNDCFKHCWQFVRICHRSQLASIDMNGLIVRSVEVTTRLLKDNSHLVMPLVGRHG